MKIYLGLSGSETLLPEENRGIGFDRDEGNDLVITEDNSLYEYTTEEKKTFIIDYDKITQGDYDDIETKYQLKADLNFKIETGPDTNLFTTYLVRFIKAPTKKLWREIYIEGVKTRIYEGVSFVVREV